MRKDATVTGVDEEERSDSRRRLLLVVGAVVLVAVLVGVFLATRGGDAGGDGTAVADREGLALTGVQLTDVDGGIDPATGLPTTDRDTYAVGEGARLWVQFTYEGDAPGQDALFVRWYRDGSEIFQSSWRLPQPVENHNVALGSSYTQEPGAYRVEVALGDEVLHTANFTVD